MKKATVLSQADRRGITAFSVFAFLCLAGILTLFSQVNLESSRAQSHGPSTSLNPGKAGADGLGDLLPATIERGASFAQKASDREAGDAKKKPARPILRMR